MADAYLQKAENFKQQGFKKLKSGNFFSNLFTDSSQKYEEASELFSQSALNYKLANKPAETYLECVKCQEKISDGEPANFLVESAQCFQTVDLTKSIDFFNQASDLHLQQGRIAQAGKIKKNILEILESQLVKKRDITTYELIKKYAEKSMELFLLEQGYKYEVTKIRVRYAEICYLLELQKEDEGQKLELSEIIKGITSFEDQAYSFLEQSLTAGSSKKLFFQAALGYLICDDFQGALNKLQDYCYASPNLKGCEEFKIIEQLAEAFEKKDKNMFINIYQNYDAKFPSSQLTQQIFEHLNRSITLANQQGNFL